MIDLAGQVAIVTGAGGGLGRAYAIGLARRGARVLVNDVGGSLQGDGASASAAEAVVAQIRDQGGDAVADSHNAADDSSAKAIVEHALDCFGAVHAVVCNAGIGWAAPFEDFSMADFRRIVDVHLYGTASVVQAAWSSFKQQQYGRVVMTTSAAAFWGVHEVAPYCAGKGAIMGLTRCLALEGAASGICVNAVSPAAKTRMSNHLFGDGGNWTWRPELVEPLITYLASRECAHNGAIFAAMHGNFARIEPMQAIGAAFDPRSEITPEQVVACLDQIDDMAGARTIVHGRDAGGMSVEAQQIRRGQG